MEEAVWRPGARRGTGAQAVARGEHPAQAAGSGSESGQGDAAGYCFKKRVGASQHRSAVHPSQAALWQKIRDLTQRVYRLYYEAGLQIRVRRPRRHVTAANRQRFRALTVVDVFTRACLAIEPGLKPGGAEVVNALRRMAAVRKAPKRIDCDNGSGFSGRLVDLWAYRHGVFTIRQADRQCLYGTRRDACLNLHGFDDLTDAQTQLQAWRQGYNETRPHRSPNELSPLEYKARWAERRSEIH